MLRRLLAASSRQVLVGNRRAVGTAVPLNRACVRERRELEDARAENNVCFVTVGYRDQAVRNCDSCYVLTLNLTRSRNTGNGVVVRERTPVHRVFGYSSLGATGQVQTFRNLGADRVVLVSRNSDGREDTDDRNYDHEFDKRKTLLLLHRRSFYWHVRLHVSNTQLPLGSYPP